MLALSLQSSERRIKQAVEVAKMRALAVDVDGCLPFAGAADVVHASNPAARLRSSVSRLLRSSCPAAIRRGVSSVIIDAIYRMVRAGALAHISKKRVERITPASTNGNASPAVFDKAVVCSGVAPLVHSDPAFIGRRRWPAVIGFRVLNFASDAATASREARIKRGSVDSFCAAAVTLAFPFRSGNVSNSGEPAKSLAGDISVCHDITPHSVIGGWLVVRATSHHSTTDYRCMPAGRGGLCQPN